MVDMVKRKKRQKKKKILCLVFLILLISLIFFVVKSGSNENGSLAKVLHKEKFFKSSRFRIKQSTFSYYD